MKSYVSKINDRNLQRKRESGLTTYALYSVLILIVYNLLEQFPLIPFKTNFWEVISILALTTNILLFFVIIYTVYDITHGHLSGIRVISKPSHNEKLFESFIDYSTLLIPLVLNITALVNYSLSKEQLNIYFLILSLILLVFCCFSLFFRFKDSKINRSYTIFEGTGNVGTDKDLISVVSYTGSIIFISLSFYLLYYIDTTINKIETLKFGILFYAIPYILTKIIDLRKHDNFSVALENLEYEINVRNLSDDEIRERLQKNYMGFLLIEWIDYNLTELEKFKQTIDKELLEITSQKHDLQQIDINTYPIEYKGRSRKIKECEIELKNRALSFFKNKLKEIEYIWQDWKLDPNERNELLKLYIQIKSDFESYSVKEIITENAKAIKS